MERKRKRNRGHGNSYRKSIHANQKNKFKRIVINFKLKLKKSF